MKTNQNILTTKIHGHTLTSPITSAVLFLPTKHSPNCQVGEQNSCNINDKR